jgi:hypothetical protein
MRSRRGSGIIGSGRNNATDLDKGPAPLRQLLGEEGYQQYQKGNSENVQFAETTLSRFLPELSTPAQRSC